MPAYIGDHVYGRVISKGTVAELGDVWPDRLLDREVPTELPWTVKIVALCVIEREEGVHIYWGSLGEGVSLPVQGCTVIETLHPSLSFGAALRRAAQREKIAEINRRYWERHPK